MMTWWSYKKTVTDKPVEPDATPIINAHIARLFSSTTNDKIRAYSRDDAMKKILREARAGLSQTYLFMHSALISEQPINYDQDDLEWLRSLGFVAEFRMSIYDHSRYVSVSWAIDADQGVGKKRGKKRRKS